MADGIVLDADLVIPDGRRRVSSSSPTAAGAVATACATGRWPAGCSEAASGDPAAGPADAGGGSGGPAHGAAPVRRRAARHAVSPPPRSGSPAGPSWAGCRSGTSARAPARRGADRRGRAPGAHRRGRLPRRAGSIWPGRRCRRVRCPTLLIVGANDPTVLDLNRQARRELRVETVLEVVPGASHLFEEPGALDVVADLATTVVRHPLASPRFCGDARFAKPILARRQNRYSVRSRPESTMSSSWSSNQTVW